MPVNTNKNGQCRSQYLFDPQTTRYLGTVQIHYTQTTYNAAVKCYVRYIKERFKWWALGLSAILLILPLWLNPSHDLKFTGVSRLVLIFTLVCLWSMFLLISRRINDFKFTQQGQVTVRVRYDEGEMLHFDVEDSGIGIPQDELDKIFAMYYQVKRDRSSPDADCRQSGNLHGLCQRPVRHHFL